MTEEERKMFEELVDKELHANNYFMLPYNMAKPFHRRLMDFAALYCMEHYNMNYHFELIKE